MIPRFSNPHRLPDSTNITSRSELYPREGEDAEISFTEDPIAIAQLNELLAKNTALLRHESNIVTPRSRKHTPTESEDSHESRLEKPILFRLVSSALPPQLVSLLPPPPPPPITREPDLEDNEIQARLRKQRAESASVDIKAFLKESSHPAAHSRSKVIRMQSKLELEEPLPSVMIVRTLQSPRKTRPPVPSTIPKKYPYVPDRSPMDVELAGSRTRNFLTIDVQRSNEASKQPRKRSRRRRKIDLKERPPPQFWRPSSTLTGKCRGYAYGYPSYVASAMGSLRKKYTRDSMKKGILVDNS